MELTTLSVQSDRQETHGSGLVIFHVFDLDQALEASGFAPLPGRTTDAWRDVFMGQHYAAKSYSHLDAYNKYNPANVLMEAVNQLELFRIGLPVTEVIGVITDGKRSVFIERRFLTLSEFLQQFPETDKQEVAIQLIKRFVDDLVITDICFFDLTDFQKVLRDTGIQCCSDGSFRIVHTDITFVSRKHQHTLTTSHLRAITTNIVTIFRTIWRLPNLSDQ
ncbi:MAG: hypothetical protein PHS44_03660, partial [Candidatus Dojkabacteria bacterium]|nr:hypothetical protein [Candidatus Dojkabacteria bacterium]